MDERIKIEYRLLKHRQRVNIIAAKARRLAQDGIKYRIYHKTTNSTRSSTRKPEAIINISGLDHIISIDKRRRRAGVEPNHGLIPTVVPEFTGITVGGAFSDTALESSSFRYGHIEKCVTSVEKLDLFSSLSGACGTLGICTIIEIKLVPARQFVEIKYLSVHSAAEALNSIKDYTATTSFVDFVDVIMFGPNDGAVIIGTMTDEKKLGMPVARFSRAHGPWFALHVHDIITELVLIKDYLFRYDRAAFWTGMYGRNPNVFNGAKSLYAGLHHSGQGQSFFIQYITLPENTVGAFINWTNQKAATDSSPRSNRHSIPDMLVNVGVWGLKTIRGLDDIPGRDGAEAFQEFLRDNIAIEQVTRDLGGTKMLYATNYYMEEEFWRIHNKEAHDELRDKWGAAGLPSLWEKLSNPNLTYKEKSSRFKVVMKTLLK
ncbi:hypothetical protein BDP55DRAFT_694379 [Colletotrichum godetiae]|uniref:Delta(24)-sterol reductase n=1 Tax=Colletotrichum godetiae TaxID=1209918 RepID=A0AAJ0AJG0_9PEZI|nr:uncharacterized protein BDP55DRAFT_694379 [Colletotrichum godetiae]KAK1675019.1 hypothetical protein BDP55DRAFT_694379 [Colletotrichum godetiae]